MTEISKKYAGLCSWDAEQCVLGGLMLDNESWDDAALLLKSDDFFHRVHRVIFDEMV
ncbi:DnaB-like helicase N-terminal domain-containing protein [Erwinia mallotivora]|uniref:DnaB-like helicase N-terminal domain-containing protein n=1 Tax=Erwinia mallotivora TaxID=69222 RepID=UPI0035EFB95E